MDPALLVDHLQRLSLAEGNGWHVSTVQAIAGLTPRGPVAALPGWPCIWELAAHIRYWVARMTVVLEALCRGGAPPPRSGTDWPQVPDAPDPAAWACLQAELARALEGLPGVVSTLKPVHLLTPSAGMGSPSALYEIHGLLAHTSDHTGQILLLRRLRCVWPQ